MIIIPRQLQNEIFRFTLVMARGKKPFEPKWQSENNYRWNEQKLQQWLVSNGNYGIATGYGCLLVVDCDGEDNNVEKILDTELPKTFKVRTGGGGSHFYFFCPSWRDSSKNIRDEKKSPVEIKWKGTQVIAPGSLHSSGNVYKVENDELIAVITPEQLKFALRDYLKEEFQEDVVETQQNTYGSKIADIIDTKGFINRGDELQGCHPVHGSNGGANFCVNPSKNTWHCFRCSSGGSVASWIAVKEKLIDCSEAKKGKIKGELWQKVCQIARTKYNLTIAPSKGIDTELDVETFGFIKDEKVYEEIWNKETNDYGFIYLNSETPKVAKVIDEWIPVPPSSKMLSGNVIVLASNAEPYESELKLVDEIQAHIHKYLDIEKEHLINASYYIMLTWVYDRFNTLPYLRALGDTGSGKSRFLKVIGDISYRRTETSGAITPAVIFRIAEKTHGTLIIDEADRRQSDTTEEITKILNCGFEKGKFVLRCDKDNPDDIHIHDVYSPKVISSRRTFTDKALESRCITTVMKQTIRNDIPYVLGNKYESETEHLRNKLLMYRLKNWSKIIVDSEENETLIRSAEIEPRLKQICSSLIALFPDLPTKQEFIKFMIGYNKELVEERSNSWEGRIVNAIFDILNEGVESMTCLDIANKINEDITSDDKKTSARSVASVLKGLGVPVKKERLGKEVRRYLTLTSCGNLMALLKARYYVEESVDDCDDCDDVTQSAGLPETKSPFSKNKNVESPYVSSTSSTSSTNLEKTEILDTKSAYNEKSKSAYNNELTPIQNTIEILHRKSTPSKYAEIKQDFVKILGMLPEEADEKIGFLVSKGIITEAKPDQFVLVT